MIQYHTQFSDFYRKYDRPCTPALVATDAYFYDILDVQKTTPLARKADYYSSQIAFLGGDFRGIFVVDIEHLDMTKPESISHLKSAIKLYRDRNHWLRIGMYDTMPKREYFAPLKPMSDPIRTKWNLHNFSLRSGVNSLAHSVDFVMPSLYPWRLDMWPDWQKFAMVNLNQAAQYDKPIIPALCPFFEGEGDRPYIGDQRLQTMLDTVRNHPCKVEGMFWWQRPGESYPDSFFKVLRNAA